ncbi:hypothetical protein BJX64DRAFT_270213 [Aspergillus heterothallicus]
MASLNLSANGPSISKSYQSVVDYPLSESARGSPTFAKWAVFSVSTPLVSAFQQDPGSKESVLKVQDTGEGELADLIDEFSEGKIQFAFVKVTDVNTGLPKSVLIAWCGEGVPERTKGYFTSHLSAVSKFLHGYHVQITARSDADLTVEGIVHKVGDASGAKYTPAPDRIPAPGPKPPVSSKPVFTPLRTGGISTSTASAQPLPVHVRPIDDDGWGPDAPPVTRTDLEKVKSAYQPTKVNIQELRSGKQYEPAQAPDNARNQADDVVKGGYQPIGKVDIAAIRRQAREAGDLKDDRPDPVKGAYEPVGKVDIAAIRAKAQKTDTDSRPATSTPSPSENTFGAGADHASDQTGRLTYLPKPKVSNRFGGGSAFIGTKPPLPVGTTPKSAPAPPIGTASRTFADQGGKTPAQLWAEKKARERGQEPLEVVSNDLPATIQHQTSGGGEWRSSYSGKTWAPVQTTHTGRSAQSSSNEPAGFNLAEQSSPETAVPQQSVTAIRDQLTQGPPQKDNTPSVAHMAEPVPPSKDSVDATTFETLREEDDRRPISPSPPPQPPRSPTPDILERESSPIRVAMPVGRGVVDNDEEQILAPAPEHAEDTQQDFADERSQPANIQHASVSPTETSHVDSVDTGKLRAIVQYDYEKAEDNEVDLREGEHVSDIDMVDKDWWLGVNARGERGLFPSNYVEIIENVQQADDEPHTQPHAAYTAAAEPVPEPVSPVGSRSKPTAKALYDYEAAEDNELSFPDGAEITNIDFPDDDWWYGEYRGKTGLFPANYVQLESQ